MAIKYEKKKTKQNNIIYTVVTVLLLFLVLTAVVRNLYYDTREDAYENLHVQTKQIKDDIILQLTSDRENLSTMANFAAKLYSDGDDYSLLFNSFRSIGMIENIGILNPDNTLSTKAGTVSVEGTMSFEEEKKKGVYISGRIEDVTKQGYELIRSVVPIEVDGEVVGILYGAIKPDKLGARYKSMVDELNAQLFVYEKSSGDILIDTIHSDLGNISFLKDRKYTDGTSYEQLVTTDKGFVSFLSAYRNENLHLHYSEIVEFDWMIALGRYDEQVFNETHNLAKLLLLVFGIMICIIGLYIFILMTGDKRINDVAIYASEVRKKLLETVDGQNNIFDALVVVCQFAKARSAVFFDTNGDDYKYVSPEYESATLLKNDRQYFKTELFRYAAELYKHNMTSVNVMCIKPNKHLLRTNPSLYNFLKENDIFDVSFAAVVNNANHITILGTVNSKNGISARMLAEKTVACFSMALYNKNHINKTEIAATTDSLTGVWNRVSYKNDIEVFDKEQAKDFSCIYIDVNELHICNNKYGHAAGDEMLMYVANALKGIFEGHRVYRIGGDEFLVFAKNTEKKVIKEKISALRQQLEARNYHVAIGVSYRSQNLDTEEIVKEAEVRMYEAKALYYQTKEQQSTSARANNEFVQINTGIVEIDTMLSILNENYNGIYRVSLDTDKARRILMPAYLKYNENEEHFSNLFSRYVSESVGPDYHRSLTSFLNYDVIRRQLMEGKVPKIRYKKNNGEPVVLSVYRLCNEGELVCDTLWVFAKA